MKRTLLVTTLVLAGSLFSYAADGVIASAMKKYHKGDTAPCKKVAAGNASDAEVAEFVKAYTDMCGAKPPKGDASAWQAKCKSVLTALDMIQKKNPAGPKAFEKAIRCKACHSEHKGK